MLYARFVYNQTIHWNSEGLPCNHKFHRSENLKPTLKIRFLWDRVHCRLAKIYPVSTELCCLHLQCILINVSFLGNPQGLDGNLLQNAGNHCATERLPHSGRLISEVAVRTSHLPTPIYYISIFLTTKNIFTGSCV